MPKILDNGRFRVYIFANDDNPHHLPHCHVYWDGNDHASVVSLPDLGMIVGETLPRTARRFLRANLAVLMAEMATPESVRGVECEKSTGPSGHAFRVCKPCG